MTASDSEVDDHKAAVPVSLTLHTSGNLAGSVSSSTVTDSVCDAECCQMMTGKPYQPPDSVLSCKRIQGQQNRYFQQSWFADHSWVSYCITLHKAFCFSCHFAASKALISERNKASNSYRAFVINGFDNWKKAKQRFHEHERSQLHLEATMKLQSLNQPSVAAQLSQQVGKNQSHRRLMLLKALSSIQMLSKQGLPFRGHEEMEGNYFQLLLCRSDDVDGLKQWVHSGKYMSHEIINELIAMMAHEVLHGII